MRYERMILAGLAALLLATLVYRNRPGSVASAPAVSAVTASADGFVRIGGAVRHPGMYPVSAKILAIDAINMAVPLRPLTEDESAVVSNLPLASGDAIELLNRPDGRVSIARGSIPAGHRLVLGIPLDIGSMSEEDFGRVPGIGPAMARRIVEYRQKNGGKLSKRELLSIEGIGEKKYFMISRYFN